MIVTDCISRSQNLNAKYAFIIYLYSKIVHGYIAPLLPYLHKQKKKISEI